MVDCSKEGTLKLQNIELFFIYTTQIRSSISANDIRSFLFSSKIPLAHYYSLTDDLFERDKASHINIFRDEDKLYFSDQYLRSVSHVRIEVPGFSVLSGGDEVLEKPKVCVFLLLQQLPILSFLFWLRLPAEWHCSQVLRYVLFPETRLDIHVPSFLQCPDRSGHADKKSTASITLTELHSRYFKWVTNVDNQSISRRAISAEGISPFVIIVCGGVSPPCTDAKDCLTRYRYDLFNIIEARPKYLGYDFASSRKDEEIDRVLKDLSSRRHVARFLTSERYLIVQAAVPGSNYPPRREYWFINNVIMTEHILYMKGHMRSLLDSLRTISDRSPSDVESHRHLLFSSIRDYLLMRDPKYQRTAGLGKALRKTLELDELLDTVSTYLDRLSNDLQIQYSRSSERRQAGIQRALEFLYILAALPGASEIANLIGLSQNKIATLLIWILAVMLFYILRYVLPSRTEK